MTVANLEFYCVSCDLIFEWTCDPDFWDINLESWLVKSQFNCNCQSTNINVIFAVLLIYIFSFLSQQINLRFLYIFYTSLLIRQKIKLEKKNLFYKISGIKQHKLHRFREYKWGYFFYIKKNCFLISECKTTSTPPSPLTN